MKPLEFIQVIESDGIIAWSSQHYQQATTEQCIVVQEDNIQSAWFTLLKPNIVIGYI